MCDVVSLSVLSFDLNHIHGWIGVCSILHFHLLDFVIRQLKRYAIISLSFCNIFLTLQFIIQSKNEFTKKVGVQRTYTNIHWMVLSTMYRLYGMDFIFFLSILIYVFFFISDLLFKNRRPFNRSHIYSCVWSMPAFFLCIVFVYEHSRAIFDLIYLKKKKKTLITFRWNAWDVR